MTEEVTQQQQDQAAEQDFAKGFGEARVEETPAKTDKPEANVEAKPQESAAEKPAQAETPAEEKPTLVGGLTEEEWNARAAKAAGVEELRSEIRKNFGQIGEVKRTLEDLSKKLAAGTATRKITKEALKRVNEELPGLGDALAADLSELLGTAEAAQEKAEAQGKAFDPDAYFAEKLAPALQQLEARANEKAELRIVKSIHRDFETVVKSQEFAGWLKTLPEEKQKEFRDSEDGFVAADAVTEFKDWTAKQKKVAEKKQTRLEAAVTPQGAAKGHEPITQDEDALFEKGFKTAGNRYATR